MHINIQCVLIFKQCSIFKIFYHCQLQNMVKPVGGFTLIPSCSPAHI